MPPAAIAVADARNTLSDVVNRVAYGKERVVLTRHGREVAALVPIEDLALLDRIRRFVARKDVDRALRDLERGRSKSWDTLKRELSL